MDDLQPTAESSQLERSSRVTFTRGWPDALVDIGLIAVTFGSLYLGLIPAVSAIVVWSSLAAGRAVKRRSERR